MDGYLEPGQRLCVALSGGLDSVVLLHAALSVAQDVKARECFAAHVNHGISLNSDRWESFCEFLTEALGVKLHSYRVSVLSQGEGLEASARQARYNTLQQSDCDWILLGHHRNDQAETLLLNILRGSGVHGASAMRERNGKLLRPLLGFSRDEIALYAKDNGLSWVEDESNLDKHFRRNFLRHDVVPLLETKFPQTVSSLVRAASLFADSAGLLDEMAKDDLGLQRLLLVKQLQDKTLARAANLLAYYLRKHKLQIPSSATLNEMLRQLLEAGCDSEICFKIGDHEVRRFQGRIYVERAPRPVSPCAWSLEPVVAWGSDSIRCLPARGNGVSMAELTKHPLKFSYRQGGETLQLRVDGPQRQLKDLMREAVIPPWRRKSLPILFAGNDVVWVEGLGIAAKYQCKPDEEGILIEFDRLTW